MSAISDFLSSLLEAIKFRVTTSIVATYVFFWIAMHWQGFYTALFVDQQLILDKFKLLKNEYIETYFFGFHPDQPWFWAGYVVPAVAAVLFIWVLPKWVFLPAFKIERRYKLDRKLVILDNDREYEREKARTERQRARRKEAEVEAVEAEQKIEELDPSKGFSRDYQAFRRRPGSRQVLKDLRECIYTYRGYISVSAQRSETGLAFRLDRNTLATAHANELVEIASSTLSDRLELTSKGKYFLAQLD